MIALPLSSGSSRLALGLLLLALLGVVRPARAGLVVQSLGVSNTAAFSLPEAASVSIGNTELGHQADRLEYDGPGVSAVLEYESIVPDSEGSSFSIRSFTELSRTEDGVFGFGTAEFHIEFAVDATQEFRFLGGTLDGSGNTDGEITFVDLTTNTYLFFAFFADGAFVDLNLTLEKGHAYRFVAPLQVLLNEDANPSGREWFFQLSAVPEPSTAVMMGLGAVALLAPAARRRAANGRRGRGER